MGRTSGPTRRRGSVRSCTPWKVSPGAISRRRSPSFVTSIQARSVQTADTQRVPVSGSEHCLRILGLPSLVACSIITTTRRAPTTRSIPPPIPFTIFPGTSQFARSPFSDTSSAPRMARSTWPPRIIANDSAEEKKAAPGRTVTVSFPALMRSASSSPSTGYGPTPRIPFSDCRTTSMPDGT